MLPWGTQAVLNTLLGATVPHVMTSRDTFRPLDGAMQIVVIVTLLWCDDKIILTETEETKRRAGQDMESNLK